MSYGQSPVVQSLLLRNELQRLRKTKGLTQKQVAEPLEWSTAKLLRIEGGRTPLTRTDLHVLLDSYGVTEPGERERLQELARGSREPGWWQSYKDRSYFSDDFLAYVGYEAGASFIRQTQNSIIPGLLQTKQYAEAYIARMFGPEKVTLPVQFRLQRQEELNNGPNPPRQFFILDEAVIRRCVGVKVDPEIMPAQLDQLVKAVEKDHIDIAVIPFNTGEHQGMNGNFTLLQFEGDLADILYLEGPQSNELISDHVERITTYAEFFENLQREALPPTESVQLIETIADEMRSKHP
jgi:transcriptional regulator with XRE-family HTH domain